MLRLCYIHNSIFITDWFRILMLVWWLRVQSTVVQGPCTLSALSFIGQMYFFFFILGRGHLISVRVVSVGPLFVSRN
ncbi:hypothetical protein EDD16DRAFT_1623994 [Pisolithus croceorrhizus]|nr:hypothetical protein EDD16DRAFT_1623994 [Pisolithus croceorrhizus]KAI6167840.1 hypothetical protein EDD17DRAFT_1535461 [Pisolithus thermaeus]